MPCDRSCDSNTPPPGLGQEEGLGFGSVEFSGKTSGVPGGGRGINGNWDETWYLSALLPLSLKVKDAVPRHFLEDGASVIPLLQFSGTSLAEIEALGPRWTLPTPHCNSPTQ